MKILTVIPIVKGIAPAALTYFSSTEVTPGMLVKVPIRGKSVPALVTEVENAASQKSTLRSASFGLKKIDSIITGAQLDPVFMTAIDRIAFYHATTAGNILNAFLPTALMDILPTLSPLPFTSEIKNRSQTEIGIQSSFTDRVTQYKTHIHNAFAQNQSVVCIAPTAVEADMLHQALAQHIPHTIFLFTPNLAKKKLTKTWNEIRTITQPVCIVGTIAAGIIDRPNIGLYIVEHESSALYKQQSRPFMDARMAIQEIAHYRNASIVWGDSFLRVETIFRLIEKEPKNRNLLFGSPQPLPFELIDMKALTDDTKRNALSDQVLSALSLSAANKTHSFVYTLRKGHSSFTICRDCSTVLMCPTCKAPMVLHVQKSDTSPAENLFICHRCSATRASHTVCDTCGSWRLEMYGAGVERVVESLTNHLPEVPVFSLSADTVSTPLQARKIIDAWQQTPNGILVGTDMALSYVRGMHIGTAVVASIDTLLTLPDIGVRERLFRVVSDLREISDTFYVQTRNVLAPIWEWIKNADKAALYTEQQKTRSLLTYPPYSILIKVTRSGRQEDVMKDLDMISTLCAPYQTLVYPAFISHMKGRYHAHALITIPSSTWPDISLIEKLRSLPPSFVINVAPESIL